MLKKEYFTKEGLNKIIAIRASINNGLTENLEAAFTNIIPVSRPKVDVCAQKILHPYWVAGFTEGRRLLFYTSDEIEYA